MTDATIEQALYEYVETAQYRLSARSPGFGEVWQARAEALCAGFGERPADVQCPTAVFAYPFLKGLAVVVQVSDRNLPAPALAFRFLVLPLRVYGQRIGDPFQVAERFPAPWSARGELPALEWTLEPPARTVEQVQHVLQREDGPLLLGAVQALVDGSRLVFERAEPAPDLVRSLWTLLPDSVRAESWPASFAFSNSLRFQVLAMPRIAEECAGYLTEQQAEDYAEGSYELNLQIAAEAGDQQELDRLFARRSHRQTLHLALFMVAGALALLALMYLLLPPPAR
jgi:hypothetical protein